jgi:Tfp pilus assembly protein PilN
MSRVSNNLSSKQSRVWALIWQPSVLVSLLSFSLLVLLAMYMYFLSFSVVHVVLRKEAQQSIASLQTEIAALESAYIEVKHQVSERIAKAENLTETSDKVFLTRTAPTVALGRE